MDHFSEIGFRKEQIPPETGIPFQELSTPVELSQKRCDSEVAALNFSPELGAIQELLVRSERLESMLNGLNGLVEKRLGYDRAKEEAFDRLYCEMEEVKRNSSFEQQRPLFIDLILLFDRINSAAQNSLTTTVDEATLSSLIQTLSEELVEILYRRDVELIEAGSNTFDPAIQQAIGTEPAESEAEDNCVARVVRRGFRCRNGIVRPEEVIVKKLIKQSNQNSI